MLGLLGATTWQCTSKPDYTLFATDGVHIKAMVTGAGHSCTPGVSGGEWRTVTLWYSVDGTTHKTKSEVDCSVPVASGRDWDLWYLPGEPRKILLADSPEYKAAPANLRATLERVRRPTPPPKPAAPPKPPSPPTPAPDPAAAQRTVDAARKRAREMDAIRTEGLPELSRRMSAGANIGPLLQQTKEAALTFDARLNAAPDAPTRAQICKTTLDLVTRALDEMRKMTLIIERFTTLLDEDNPEAVRTRESIGPERIQALKQGHRGQLQAIEHIAADRRRMQGKCSP